ncbi:MAG: endolytic transglycosylase MltG [Actinomyces urogenitalis]|uniref:endolytic transglycosylase MltG n=1 Tax=Actinomyces urogenitalis TaxID=103621 RepID=UPI002A82DC82|nr:endolytic transglycosylase MltG [Actinomyces urogenitalis]MDY3677772.1 endolytic transglycosylase MltG [Actinomyces urogenitalis]
MSQDDFFATLGEGEGEGEAQPSAPRQNRSARRERSRQRLHQRRRRRRRALISTLVLVLVLAGVGFVAYQALDVVKGAVSGSGAVSDYTGAGTGEVVVTIPEGASGGEIGQILKDAGVVATVGAFTDAYAANSNASKIQAGTYTLRLQMSAANAVAALLDPASRSDHTLTIPEGYTMAQVKDRLVSVAGFTSEEVDAAFADASGIGLPEAAGGQVEGWLAPSTYDVSENATATDVVGAMVSLTLSRLESAGVAASDYETVLIKASIVEREVASASYYGQVARVIENRLADTDGETKGRLQMDSTVLYGLGRTGGIPTADEVADASNPYNTYQHEGLPPGPISNPGLEAIQGVINPPAGDWLYFVTVNLDTGETLFSATHEEQLKNTEQLTAWCQEHAETCSGQSTSSAGN